MTARTNQSNNMKSRTTYDALGSGLIGRCQSTAEGQGEGPVQQLVAPAAKRSGTGDLPDEGSEAVAPGEAKAVVEDGIGVLEAAALEREKDARDYAHQGYELTANRLRLRANGLRYLARALKESLPEPDSEASFSELRGRRNGLADRPDKGE